MAGECPELFRLTFSFWSVPFSLSSRFKRTHCWICRPIPHVNGMSRRAVADPFPKVRRPRPPPGAAALGPGSGLVRARCSCGAALRQRVPPTAAAAPPLSAPVLTLSFGLPCRQERQLLLTNPLKNLPPLLALPLGLKHAGMASTEGKEIRSRRGVFHAALLIISDITAPR